ncbi:MAG: hypothetical protein ACOC26_06975 [Halochromatium sp.]
MGRLALRAALDRAPGPGASAALTFTRVNEIACDAAGSAHLLQFDAVPRQAPAPASWRSTEKPSPTVSTRPSPPATGPTATSSSRPPASTTKTPSCCKATSIKASRPSSSPRRPRARSTSSTASTTTATTPPSTASSPPPPVPPTASRRWSRSCTSRLASITAA